MKRYRKGNQEFKVYKTTWTFNINGEFVEQGKIDKNTFKFLKENGFKEVK